MSPSRARRSRKKLDFSRWLSKYPHWRLHFLVVTLSRTPQSHGWCVSIPSIASSLLVTPMITQVALLCATVSNTNNNNDGMDSVKDSSSTMEFDESPLPDPFAGDCRESPPRPDEPTKTAHRFSVSWLPLLLTYRKATRFSLRLFVRLVVPSKNPQTSTSMVATAQLCIGSGRVTSTL